MSEVDDLRREIVEMAGKIRAAYGHKDMAAFHLNVGILGGLSMRLYEANAKEELGPAVISVGWDEEWDPDSTPRLPGEPDLPEHHFRENPDAEMFEGSHCGDDGCEYCDWVYGERDDYYEEAEF